jgi:hypothetical protein
MTTKMLALAFSLSLTLIGGPAAALSALTPPSDLARLTAAGRLFPELAEESETPLCDADEDLEVMLEDGGEEEVLPEEQSDEPEDEAPYSSEEDDCEDCGC